MQVINSTKSQITEPPHPIQISETTTASNTVVNNTECPICCEKYTKLMRIKIECPYCNFCACRICCQKFLLSKTIPTCINTQCNKEWSRRFIFRAFPATFLNRDLKTHREKILLDSERALLPATQPVVERIILKEKLINRRDELKLQINQLKKDFNEVENELYKINSENPDTVTQRAIFVRACPDPNCRGFLSSQWKCGLCTKWSCANCHEIIGIDKDAPHTCLPENIATAKLLNSDTKSCPTCGIGIFKIEGCFGENIPILMWDRSIKMSQHIQVGDILMGDDRTPRTVLQLMKGADELYEILQNNGINYIVNSKHSLVLMLKNGNEIPQIIEITPDEYIMREIGFRASIPHLMGYKLDGTCTNISVRKIGQGIYYGWLIDKNHRFLLSDTTVVRNCHQMWCTQCHTAFNWQTGQLESNIHNPHYYEWLRKNNKLDRNPNDIPCNRHINQNFINRVLANVKILTNYTDEKNINISNYSDILDKFLNICRGLIHLHVIELPKFQTNQVNYNQLLRIQFLRNLITEEEFRITLQRKDKKFQRNKEIADIVLMVINAATEIMFRFQDYINQYLFDLQLNSYIDRMETDYLSTSQPNASSTQFTEPQISIELDASFFIEYDCLIDYANEYLIEIANSYSYKPLQINKRRLCIIYI